MKIMIIGATGGTGRLAVEQALARGYQVSVYARNPHNLPNNLPNRANLTIIKGELNDTSALANAMTDTDAVLCCLGTHQLKKVTLMQTQLPLIINAMKQSGVARLVLLSAYGVGESFDSAGLIAKIAYKTMVKDVYADKAKSEQLLPNSGLVWTKIYPVILTDGVLSDDVEMEFLPNIKKVKGLPKVSRANVAKTMLDVIMDARTHQQTVVLSTANSIVKTGH